MALVYKGRQRRYGTNDKVIVDNNQHVSLPEVLKNLAGDIVSQPIVEDSKIITSWNPSTVMGVAFLLLEKSTSKENAHHIKKLMRFVK